MDSRSIGMCVSGEVWEVERDVGVLYGRTTSLRRDLVDWRDVFVDLQR